VPFGNLLIINENPLYFPFLNRLFAMNLHRGLQNAVQPANISYNYFPHRSHMACDTISAAATFKIFRNLRQMD